MATYTQSSTIYATGSIYETTTGSFSLLADAVLKATYAQPLNTTARLIYRFTRGLAVSGRLVYRYTKGLNATGSIAIVKKTVTKPLDATGRLVYRYTKGLTAAGSIKETRSEALIAAGRIISVGRAELSATGSIYTTSTSSTTFTADAAIDIKTRTMNLLLEGAVKETRELTAPSTGRVVYRYTRGLMASGRVKEVKSVGLNATGSVVSTTTSSTTFTADAAIDYLTRAAAIEAAGAVKATIPLGAPTTGRVVYRYTRGIAAAGAVRETRTAGIDATGKIVEVFTSTSTFTADAAIGEVPPQTKYLYLAGSVVAKRTAALDVTGIIGETKRIDVSAAASIKATTARPISTAGAVKAAIALGAPVTGRVVYRYTKGLAAAAAIKETVASPISATGAVRATYEAALAATGEIASMRQRRIVATGAVKETFEIPLSAAGRIALPTKTISFGVTGAVKETFTLAAPVYARVRATILAPIYVGGRVKAVYIPRPLYATGEIVEYREYEYEFDQSIYVVVSSPRAMEISFSIDGETFEGSIQLPGGVVYTTPIAVKALRVKAARPWQVVLIRNRRG